MTGLIIIALISSVFNIITTLIVCIQLIKIKDSLQIFNKANKVDSIEKAYLFYKNGLINEEDFHKLRDNIINSKNEGEKINNEQ